MKRKSLKEHSKDKKNLSASNVFSMFLNKISRSNNLPKEEILELFKNEVEKTWIAEYGEGYDIFSEISEKGIFLFVKLEVVKEITNAKKQIVDKSKSLGTIVEKELPMKISPKLIFALENKIKSHIKIIKREKEYAKYENLVGEIFTCEFIKRDNKNLVVKVDNEYFGIVIEPKDNSTLYKKNIESRSKIVCLLKAVRSSSVKEQLIFERVSNEFIEKLLEKIIPEIKENTVEIKKIARKPGVITKIMVAGPNAISSCIGRKSGSKEGNRVETIKNCLLGENVEFVLWNEDINQRIINCFRGCEIRKIILLQNSIEVVVKDDHYGKAIGLMGHKVKLVSQLLETAVTVTEETKYLKEKEEALNEKINDLMKFDIEKKDAEYIVNKYGFDLFYGLNDQSLDKKVLKNLEKYLDSILEEEKEEFVKSGGDEKLFMCIPGTSSDMYFFLLENSIKNFEDIRKFDTAEQLSEKTGMENEICILLMDKAKNF